MKRFFYISCAMLLALMSCQQRMNIQGTTSVPELEGRMLYLRVFENQDLVILDSAQITHGQFHFTGTPKDSTVMAFLFLGDESLLPVVIEEGRPLQITLNETERQVEGSVLNDSLYAFIRRKSVFDQQLADLPHRESQMILEGYDHDEILMQLNQEAAFLNAQEETMVMRFIKDNMDNILAPGVFMMMTSQLPYPILNPQIEELVTLGSSTFLNDAYVKDYLQMAQENMDKMRE